MAKFCQVCGKGAMFGNNVSHSERKTRRKWRPNTQKVRIMDGQTPRTIYVCTRCLRSQKVQRAY